ncbi:MAG TPA: hypothetical protein VGD56_11730 [Gemmatirosa sp.]
MGDTTLLARPRDRADRGGQGYGELSERRQCRTSGIPAGWIAVAYVAAPGDCAPRGVHADSTSNAALIVRYGPAPVGTRLDVCVDQPIPPQWSEATDEAPGDPNACPGAASRDHDTVRRIRRDF